MSRFIRVAAFFAICLGACAFSVAGEPIVVDVWPGETPQDKGIQGEEREFQYDSDILGESTRLITNVTHPTISIYPAPGDLPKTAMIICPGGGYHNLFWDLEGVEVANWLNEHGMTGVILKYRCPRREGDIRGEPPLGPLLDAQRTISLVRSRAKEWNIDPDRIGMVGFSAGGHLCLATATNFDQRKYTPIDDIDKVSCRPDFAVLCYSGYLKSTMADTISPGLRVPEGTPPIFLAHSSDDKISDSEHSVFMYLALKRGGAPAELHVYVTGDHDFGVRKNDRLPSSWTDLCLNWLTSRELLVTKAPMKDDERGRKAEGGSKEVK